MSQRLKLLTYNAGLFRVRFFGHSVFAPAPHIEERFAALPAALRSSGADIIALQEVYDAEHQSALVAAMAPDYPYSAVWSKRRFGRMCSGLMLFSKYPIASFEPHHFRDLPWDESFFVHKGILIAEIEAKAFGRICVANCHHTSGGALWNPEGRFAERIRSRQYQQLFSVLEATSADKRLAMGDFNCGPEATSGSYRELVANGYIDAWAEKNSGSSCPTWDSSNPLNAGGPHRKSLSQRLDHVLMNPVLAASFKVAEARIVLHEPAVEVPGAGRFTISDHYGLLVELENDSR
jgi:endonuclease/exonuclease/phosphatase family metal-dependent hydrolase